MKKGDLVHIDTDNAQWGRVASDGEIVGVKSNGMYLISAYSIKANILVAKEDIEVTVSFSIGSIDLESMIAKYQKRVKGASSVADALDLSAMFSEACRQGEAVPAWALCLRSLAEYVNRVKKAADKADLVFDEIKQRNGE